MVRVSALLLILFALSVDSHGKGTTSKLHPPRENQDIACLIHATELIKRPSKSEIEKLLAQTCSEKKVLNETRLTALGILTDLHSYQSLNLLTEMKELLNKNNCSKLKNCLDFKINYLKFALEGKQSKLIEHALKKLSLSEILKVKRSHIPDPIILKNLSKLLVELNQNSSKSPEGELSSLFFKLLFEENPPKQISGLKLEHRWAVYWAANQKKIAGHPEASKELLKLYVNSFHKDHETLQEYAKLELSKFHSKSGNKTKAEKLRNSVSKFMETEESKSLSCRHEILAEEVKNPSMWELYNPKQLVRKINTLKCRVDARDKVDQLLLARLWNNNSYNEALKLSNKLIERFNSKKSISKEDTELRSDVAWIDAHLFSEREQYGEAAHRFQSRKKWWNKSKDFKKYAAKLALWQYISGMHKSAIKTLNELAKKDKSGNFIGYSLYFQAKSQQALNEKTKAAKTYSRLMRISPFGYYGYLAHLETNTDLPALPDASKLATYKFPRRSIASARTSIKSKARIIKDNINYFRKNHEVASQLLRFASDFLYKYDRGEFFRYLEVHNQWNSLFKYSMKHLSPLYQNRTPANFRKLLIRSHYPMPYPDTVNSFTKNIGIDPLYVFSIMRRESRFDEDAVSGAPAFGLMQLIWPTAKYRSKELKLDLNNSMQLKDPSNNVKLGALEIKGLTKMFGLDPVKIASGYNAGPSAIKRWNRKYSKYDRPIFIELISYEETRKYVKEVMSNLITYNRTYRGLRKLNWDCFKDIGKCKNKI